MATGPRYKVAFRRRREYRTDYYARKRLLRSGEPRAVVRRSSRNVTVQFVDFDMNGDIVRAAATTKELRKMGWEHSCSSIPAAYLVGFLAGKRALKNGIEFAVLDIGMQIPKRGGVLFAVLKGMIDAGVEIPHGENIIPAEDRIKGKHIDGGIEAAMSTVKKKMEAD